MAVTIYRRYVLNTSKLKEFEHYAKLWIPLVEKFGGATPRLFHAQRGGRQHCTGPVHV